MQQYQDSPMDLVDASLVVPADTQGLRGDFALDQADQRIDRLPGGRRSAWGGEDFDATDLTGFPDRLS
jgi:hypothetical protein